MAMGFETTAPSTAMTVLRAAAEGVGRASEEVRQSASRAYEGRETQPESRSEGPVVVNPPAVADKVGESITTRGEERGAKRREPGREYEESDTGDAEHGGEARPAGTSSARYSTGVHPEGAESQTGTEIPPGDQGG